MPSSADSAPLQPVSVYRAAQFRVANGANLGDGISVADELVLDDIYRLSPVATPVRLSLLARAEPPFAIDAGSEVGRPGADLHLDCAVTFMSGDGCTTEALMLVETDDAGNIDGVYLLPLAPLDPRADYALVGIDPEDALTRFAQVACVSFTRGTLITLASGAQRAVEDLEIGDLVLTRDDGPQAIRWIGHTTTRAVGSFAPILIRAGVLNNTNDLVVSPDHRLFIYQRTDRLGVGRPELLVKARHLVNGDTVARLNGGFVDYYQMLFDHHQIIYAEGIAAESMLIDTRTRAALPREFSETLKAVIPGHRDTAVSAIEVQESLLHRDDAAEVLRKSSGG
ncbi:Hint domain-containing protein [Roseivivax sediminis]|uniref:Hint domain-containing protein n=1 Tax=Roseivivax sediminis TaxID=936889 RepID=A0A1I1YUJ8_9RHOB|nr:Hint domain-containing protein [Roseivivax sediminis]SFE21833.1 Hint domain-containing protein [Roseivivax sediminis]